MTSGSAIAGAVGVAVILTVALPEGILARQVPANAMDGVYTDTQATRGQQSYSTSCASCHLDTLRGEGFAPGLIDSLFADRWGSGSVGDLFTIVQATMPADNPKGLASREYADIVAFLLKVNGYPAGTAEMAPDARALKAVSMKKAAKP